MNSSLKLKGSKRHHEFPKDYKGKSAYNKALSKAPDATPYRYVFYREQSGFRAYGVNSKQNGEVISKKHIKKMNKQFRDECPNFRAEGPVCAVVCGAFLAMTIILIPLTIWIIGWHERKLKEIWIKGEQEIRDTAADMNKKVFNAKDCRLIVGEKGLFLVLYLDFLAREHGLPLEEDEAMAPAVHKQVYVNPYASAMGGQNGMMNSGQYNQYPQIQGQYPQMQGQYPKTHVQAPLKPGQRPPMQVQAPLKSGQRPPMQSQMQNMKPNQSQFQQMPNNRAPPQMNQQPYNMVSPIGQGIPQRQQGNYGMMPTPHGNNSPHRPPQMQGLNSPQLQQGQMNIQMNQSQGAYGQPMNNAKVQNVQAMNYPNQSRAKF